MTEIPSLDRLGTLILIAGISGAGKSTAIDSLSDMGMFTVENLPVPLFPQFLSFAAGSPRRFTRVALALDIDSQEKQAQLRGILDGLDPKREKVKLVFLDCKTDVVVKRYGQTRRPHPGFDPATDLTLKDAIEREKERLFPIREIAHLVIDTSELNLHELRREIKAFVEATKATPKQMLRVNFLSFGFKHGVPIDCDWLTDVRFLPNPYFVEELRDMTGKDRPVIEFVMRLPAAEEFVGRYANLVSYLLPQYLASGRSYVNIGVGCTGGRHRSVVIAEMLAGQVEKTSLMEQCFYSVKHRDIEKPQ